MKEKMMKRRREGREEERGREGKERREGYVNVTARRRRVYIRKIDYQEKEKTMRNLQR